MNQFRNSFNSSIAVLCCGVMTACANNSTTQQPVKPIGSIAASSTTSVVDGQPKPAPELTPSQEERVRRVKNRILDWKSSAHEREKALNQFASLGLSTSQKLPIFREIATPSTDRGIAASVIAALLAADDPAAFDILNKRMTWLDVRSLGAMVREHLSRYPFIDRRFLSVARYVVRKVVPLYTAKNWDYSSTADTSLVLLAMRGEAADRALICMALFRMPGKPFIWLAASQTNALTDKERQFARKQLQRYPKQEICSFEDTSAGITTIGHHGVPS